MTIENSTPDLADGKPKKASKLTVAIAVIFSVLNILIAPAVVGARFNPQRWGEFLGTLIGPIILGLLVVAIFQLAKRFRNNRSRWKIYTWTMAIMLIANFSRVAQNVAATLPSG